MRNEYEKTTAPYASVGADAEQPFVKDYTEIIPNFGDQSNAVEDDFQALQRRMAEMKSPGYLHTVTLNDLLNTAYTGKNAIIEDLLYTGTYILAGAPKIGKSFLVAQISYHVSMGIPMWDYQVKQSDVLYLALEDDEFRLQNRMYRMYGINGTDHLRFATFAKQIGHGLDEQLEFVLRKYPETRLIIIDTLQKIREVGGESYSYANDYQVISALKAFTDAHNICMLIVHHTRKQPAGDSFDMISGTNGLLGCADGAFLMQKEKRTDGQATLDIVGRDQQDQRLFLTRNQEKLLWEMERAENELWKQPDAPLLISIDQFLTEERTRWQGSATELAQELQLEMQPNALTKQLNVRAGKLQREYGIQYSNCHTRNGSRIMLIRLEGSV